jgi:hypothetical protein
VNLLTKKCEGCQLKETTFGLLAEGKRRWCGGCAKAHAGAVSLCKRCEGCGENRARFGLPVEGKRRWCSGCAKAHVGTEDVSRNKCEGCGLKAARYAGLPSDGEKRRWCADYG